MVLMLLAVLVLECTQCECLSLLMSKPHVSVSSVCINLECQDTHDDLTQSLVCRQSRPMCVFGTGPALKLAQVGSGERPCVQIGSLHSTISESSWAGNPFCVTTLPHQVSYLFTLDYTC